MFIFVAAGVSLESSQVVCLRLKLCRFSQEMQDSESQDPGLLQVDWPDLKYWICVSKRLCYTHVNTDQFLHEAVSDARPKVPSL